MKSDHHSLQGAGNQHSPAPLSQAIAHAKKLLSAGDDYNLREFIGQDELFKIHDYNTMGDRPVGTYPCGSQALRKTQDSMYRLMFLFRPECVDFTDMYKSTLVTLVSPDYTLMAEVDLFKYEMAVYFFAAKEHISGTKQHAVQAGAPGADNGIQANSQIARAWFGLLVKLLNRSWMVYGGNNFEV